MKVDLELEEMRLYLRFLGEISIKFNDKQTYEKLTEYESKLMRAIKIMEILE